MSQQPDDQQAGENGQVDAYEGDDGRQPPATQRKIERSQEEDELTQVIVRRWAESRRHPDDVLEHAIAAGEEQLERPAISLILSAIAAGLTLGFSAMAVGVASSLIDESSVSSLTARLIIAAVYPVGFILCILIGAELFTEHTATAVYPVLDRRASLRKLLRLWSLVWLGNMVGAGIIAMLLAGSDGVVGASDGYRTIAEHMVRHGTAELGLSAVLAGWLMALGAWLIHATPPSISQTVAIYIVTFLIGFGGLHHSIAGAVELFVALLIGADIAPAEAIHFIALATFGNLLGGSIMVAVLNYGHIRQSREVTQGE